MNFLSLIYIPFGYLMKICLYLSGNYYVLALLFFTIITQLLMLPLAIKQQKNLIMQRKLLPKEMAIRKKYAGRNDRVTQQKMMLEIQEMQKSEGYNQLSGCLPMLITLVLLFVLYAIIRQPITYSSTSQELTAKLDAQENSLYDIAFRTVEQYKDESLVQKEENANFDKFVETLKNIQLNFGYKEENGQLVKSGSNKNELLLTKLIQQDYDYIASIAEEYNIKLADYNRYELHFSKEEKDALPNFNFAGISLLDTPSYKKFNLLLIFPLLIFLTSVGSGYITRKYTPTTPGMENNPMVNGWFMKWGLPVVSAYFSFQFPAAVAVYWIWRTVTGAVQPIILNRFYPLPTYTKEELEAAVKEYNKKNKKKKKVIMIEVDEDDDSFKDLEVKGPVSGKRVVGKNKIEMLSADDEDEEDSESDAE